MTSTPEFKLVSSEYKARSLTTRQPTTVAQSWLALFVAGRKYSNAKTFKIYEMARTAPDQRKLIFCQKQEQKIWRNSDAQITELISQI